ncbi:MAG: hypothetical protein KDD53_08965 [Bdellovibrionales bacterium]|nr:hypothetical protein [Bdellovibrionales bacterium]
MAKEHKTPNQVTEEQATEIIELALNDIEVLTEAFQLIAQVCEHRSVPSKVEQEVMLH